MANNFDPRAGMKLAWRHHFDNAKRRGFSDKKAREIADKLNGMTSAERVANGHTYRREREVHSENFKAETERRRREEDDAANNAEIDAKRKAGRLIFT